MVDVQLKQSHVYIFKTHLWKPLCCFHRKDWPACSNLGRKLKTHGRQILNKQRALHIHRYKSDSNCIFQKHSFENPALSKIGSVQLKTLWLVGEKDQDVIISGKKSIIERPTSLKTICFLLENT